VPAALSNASAVCRSATCLKGSVLARRCSRGAPKRSEQLDQRVEAALLQKADNLSPVHGKLQKLHAAARSTPARGAPLTTSEVFLRVSPVIAASSLTASHTVRRFSSDRHGSCAAFVYSRLVVPLRSPSRHLVRLYPSSIAYSDAYSRLEGVQTPVDVTRNATQRAPPQRCTVKQFPRGVG